MKNRVIVSVGYIVIGILLVLIPTLIFPVCNASEMKMSCYYTKQVEVGLGLFVVFLGILSILWKDKKVRIGISLAQIGVAILVFLYPSTLIGLCKMSEMACRIQTFPALLVIAIVLGVVSIANVLYLGKKDIGHDKE